MAKHRTPILGPATLPDTSGNVWAEPAAITQTNKRYPGMIWRLKKTATKVSLGGRFQVPENYVQGGTLVVYYTGTTTSGNVALAAEYATVSGDNTTSLDPSAATESVSATGGAPGTALFQRVVSMALTTANFVAEKEVQFLLSRDGTSGSDTMTGDLLLYGAYFEYLDT